MAVFGLESVDSITSEDAGEVLVCVMTKSPTNTDCPVAFSFTLHLTIEENERTTAGK